MSITDCAVSNNCGCGRFSCGVCKGRKMSTFSSTSSITSGTRFVALTGSGAASENVNVTFSALVNAVNAALPVNPKGIQNINLTTLPGNAYTAQLTDDIIICTGTGTVTFPVVAMANRDVTIRSISGTVTVAAAATESTEITSLTTGNSYRAMPYVAGNGWVSGA